MLHTEIDKMEYSALLAKFKAEYRIVQFSTHRPKKLVYRNLTDCVNYRRNESDFEILHDWVEYATPDIIKMGYWLVLPRGVHPTYPLPDAPRHPLPEESHKRISAMTQAVYFQQATNCTQIEACRMFGIANQSNFKVTRDRMILSGELQYGPLE